MDWNVAIFCKEQAEGFRSIIHAGLSFDRVVPIRFCKEAILICEIRPICKIRVLNYIMAKNQCEQQNRTDLFLVSNHEER